MKRRTRFRINRSNLDAAWFPTTDPQPGQRLEIRVCTPDLRIAEQTIWYHPNDWYHPDDYPGRQRKTS